MRIVAIGAAVALAAAASVVVRGAGVLGRPAAWLRPATWGIAGYLALNAVGYLASTIPIERIAFGSDTGRPRRRSHRGSQVFVEAARHLGAAIANLVNTLNPEMIVLAGAASLVLAEMFQPALRPGNGIQRPSLALSATG